LVSLYLEKSECKEIIEVFGMKEVVRPLTNFFEYEINQKITLLPNKVTSRCSLTFAPMTLSNQYVAVTRITHPIPNEDIKNRRI